MVRVKYEISVSGAKLEAAGSVEEIAIATAHMMQSMYFKIMTYGPKHAERYKELVQAFTADGALTWSDDPKSKGECIGFDPEELRKQMELGT